MKIKKSLGQHFLRDPKILGKIADFAKIEKTDTVVEIGPGEGDLTKILLDRAKKVIAIEKDEQLAENLRQNFGQEIVDNRLEIIEGDILNYNLKSTDYKLVGNIPYYITGAIFEKFLESNHTPLSMTLVVQREVAERIIAKDGKQSILSTSINVFGDPEFGGVIKAGSFFPAPKVDSAIISVRNIGTNNLRGIKPSHFFTILKTGFAHKRKFLIRNLEVLIPLETLKKIFDEIRLPANIRAENLSVQDWVEISERLKF